MQIKIESKNSTNIITIQGEVDLSNSPKLREKFKPLLKQKNPIILIDLSQVTYMDSSGLATLVEAMQNVSKNKGKFKLAGLQGEVKNMFEIARLSEVFSIAEDVASALKSI